MFGRAGTKVRLGLVLWFELGLWLGLGLGSKVGFRIRVQVRFESSVRAKVESRVSVRFLVKKKVRLGFVRVRDRVVIKIKSRVGRGVVVGVRVELCLG